MAGRQLSSRWTFYCKFVFPALWSGGFGLGVLLLFLAPSALRPEPPPQLKFVLLGMWCFVALLMWWWLGSLKRITLEGDHLLVSNFRREVSILLRDIESVNGCVLTSPERVSLRLRQWGAFGDKIVFMPQARWTLTLSRHPIVYELRRLIEHPPNMPLQPTRATEPFGQRDAAEAARTAERRR